MSIAKSGGGRWEGIKQKQRLWLLVVWKRGVTLPPPSSEKGEGSVPFLAGFRRKFSNLQIVF